MQLDCGAHSFLERCIAVSYASRFESQELVAMDIFAWLMISCLPSLKLESMEENSYNGLCCPLSPTCDPTSFPPTGLTLPASTVI